MSPILLSLRHTGVLGEVLFGWFGFLAGCNRRPARFTALWEWFLAKKVTQMFDLQQLVPRLTPKILNGFAAMRRVAESRLDVGRWSIWEATFSTHCITGAIIVGLYAYIIENVANVCVKTGPYEIASFGQKSKPASNAWLCDGIPRNNQHTMLSLFFSKQQQPQ